MEIVSKVTGSSLKAQEFNQIPDELENLITFAGLTPSSSVLTQVSQSVTQMVSSADFYNCAGTANAIELSPISPLLGAFALVNGLKVRFQALYNNTSNVTVNLNSLGSKRILKNGNELLANDIIQNNVYIITYNSVSDYFELLDQNVEGKWTDKYQSFAQFLNMTSSDVTFDLSDYLPNDGNIYEVLISGNVQPDRTVNKYVNLYVKSDIITSSNIGICGNRTSSTSSIAEGAGSAIVPIGIGRTLIRVGLSSPNAEGKYTLYANGYRKVR